MTREIYERMPEAIKAKLDGYKKRRANAICAHEWYNIDNIRNEASAYCKGLRDAGFITDHERGILFNYTTV